MRTRRSPKNQERLFRELFKAKDTVMPATSPVCANCVSFPNNGRSRGECVLLGVIKRCTSTCVSFRERAK
jgi:hypothetical protein